MPESKRSHNWMMSLTLLIRGFLLTLAVPLVLVGAVSAVIALAQLFTTAPTLLVLYLPAVISSAVFVGSRASVVAAVASFLAFNVLFVEPRFALLVANSDEWVSLGALLLTGLVTGQLAALARRREAAAHRSERAASLLYRIARVMSARTLGEGLQETADVIREAVGAQVSTIRVALPDERFEVASVSGDLVDATRHLGHDISGVILVDHDDSANSPEGVQDAGTTRGVNGHPPSDLYHVRIPATPDDGWLSVALELGTPSLDAGTRRLLLAAASEIGEALDRERLRREATEVELLRRADDVKNDLLNTVSHDLRTPLATIMAATDSLQSEIPWDEEDRRDFLQSIADEARRLDRLVRHLLDLSRIEAGALSLQLEWHDVDDVVRLIVSRLRDTWPDRRIDVCCDPELPPAHIDRIAMDEAVGNLVENAVRHTPPETMITVRVETRASLLMITVEDDGPGVPTTQLPRLFQPFERARGLRDRRGTGLGLAVADALVWGHRGTLSASNRPGGGACFTIEIPDALAPVSPNGVGIPL